MKQASIKVKNYVDRVQILDQEIDLKVKFFYFLAISFGVFSFLYVLVLGNMVFNIIERKTVELEIRNSLNEVADLEASYLALVNTIDKDSSVSLGFVEVKPVFATRSSLGFLLEDNSKKVAINEI